MKFSLEHILDSDYLEYIVAALFLTGWWAISKTRHTLRRLNGEDEGRTSAVVTQERPRRRLPLN
jgi:hypothetical protein